MAYNPKIYGALLANTLPRVIDSDAEYTRVEEIFNQLISKKSLSIEEDTLFGLLADLMEDYERKTLPPLEKHTPLEMLKFLMESNGLKQKDIVGIFGSQGIASEVLSGKRGISKENAKKLAEKFSVSAELFI